MLSYSYSANDPGEQQVPIVAPESTTTTTEEETSSSAVASCWSPMSTTRSDLFFGIPCLLLGIALIVGGFLNPNAHPGEEKATFVMFCLFGGLMIFVGAFILLATKLSKKYGLEVTHTGINYITKRSETAYRWDEIEKVLAGQFTASRMSSTEVFLMVEPSKGKKFSVRSSFGGDPEIVIDQILTHCDYIVRNPESYTKNTK